ncbi:MAG: CmpA/NrtA family ABC transporter substrate-binding protein [Phenylobacterium sp.]|uniref:CmpA/NrtA family ABC transporter substrate-binding protein n=1 Tax=Phenylobacterium sp. TaxID=1871053 RepID=UPI002735B08A|nr:CmpA/NrtA family ABC transporter substrate-binding protein [Phenylobacterium sp.]MDP1641349.1 CmpA/NrtA family ABC transporter substrate-binding protein [Phenylobacterium sp.]MDP3118234.1 CmpA/NrtA family ABC transporter substrate-binding protein [Phenylobacterium sp.]
MSPSGPLQLGFIPLVDAAPLIVAQEKGFFAAEGLAVSLSREGSWATIRDKVAAGALDGAHMLAPMVLAASLGIGSEPKAMIAPIALNRGGAAVTLSSRLTGDGDAGAGLSHLVRRRQEEGASPLTLAAVYPFSIHNYLLRHWLAGLGLNPDVDVRLTVVPPPRTAALLGEGVIEGFCAGAPWNAVAEAAGVGQTVVRVTEVWPEAPDKVLGVTEFWAAANPAILQSLIRALARAGAWAADPHNQPELVALLARPEFLDAAPEAIAAGLAEISFDGAAVNPPRREQAAWLLEQMARWGQIGEVAIDKVAERTWRPDLYTAALGG